MRKLVIKLLRWFNPGTIKIRHHLTKKPFYLDAFLHKGYWYYGIRRERETIDLFAEILPDCSFAIDIGANIGYFSQYFCHLMNDSKKLIVFEPEHNNLVYLKRNIDCYDSIRIIEKAVSFENGTANFYVENLSGQNNSLLSDYKVFDEVLENSGLTATKTVIEVETITLDSFMEQEYPDEKPDFIKIDVEGAELFALQGMKNILELHAPTIMVEISDKIPEVLKLLRDFNYVLINPHKEIIRDDKLMTDYFGEFFNVFCIHKSKNEIFQKLKIDL
ncbi:FkbM family methyltransferase [uncultured Winogradskyella sp.]|uniref:FkbM family methyltransferase n=1 Tax=uncultured Winogradskyella sp. TaxID=395353 RepID=UPI002614C82D|nr:FkbM family methyltransferase [uncultured Winogradskyella sp.]